MPSRRPYTRDNPRVSELQTVAYFAHTGSVSGPNHSLMRLLQVLDRSRYRPVVYFPDEGRAVSAFTAAGERCRIVPMVGLERKLKLVPKYIRDSFRVTRQVRRALIADGASLVHINTSMTPYAGIAARALRLPVVWHVRECVRPNVMNDLYVRGMVRLADRLVAVSGAVLSHLDTRVPGAAAKVEVIHNGIDLDRFSRQIAAGTSCRALGLPETGTLIVVPAFLLPHKGHEVMLEATSLLVRMGLRDFSVLLAGDEPPEESGWFTRQLLELRTRLEVERHVIFLGLRADLPAVLGASDIVCLPPTYEDPFPNGVLEAMAAAKPVVATRVGGIPEMVEEGRTGLLVPCGQPRELADALATLMADPARAREMGEQGRQRLAERFTARLHGDRVQALYGRLCAGGAQGI